MYDQNGYVLSTMHYENPHARPADSPCSVARVPTCVLAFSTAVPVLAQTPEASSSSILDPANMDQKVDPGEDFYRYVNGGWLDRTSIPVDWPAFGAFQELSDRTEQQLIALLQSVDVEATGSALTDQQKAALAAESQPDLRPHLQHPQHHDRRVDAELRHVEPRVARHLHTLRRFLERNRDLDRLADAGDGQRSLAVA